MNRNHHILFTLLVAMSALAAKEAKAGTTAQSSTVPKVVVNILIDQLRTDYLEAFAPLYGEGGLKRLLGEGCVYTNAEYPLASPDRASASATLATGTTAADHGIVGVRWIDRETLRTVYCAETKEGIGPHHLSVSTIGDELKVATEGKSQVISIAPFCDAAVLTAGHAADAAVWIDDKTGLWTTSAYYGGTPSWATVRNQYHALGTRLKNTTWQPSNDLVGNFSYFLSGGMKKPFSHKFKGNEQYISFKTSGLVNDEVAAITVNAIEGSPIGMDAITDMVNVTLYAGNFNHRPVSELPMEIQDNYVRLDHAISTILEAIDKKVGLANALITLTSTGYTEEETADLSKYRIPTGTFDVKRASGLLSMYLTAIYGQGKYVEAIYGTELYLNHKLIEDRQINYQELLDRSQDFLIQLSGVKDIYTAQRLLQGAWTPGISRIRGGFNQQRSGDILIQVTPGWRAVNEDSHQNVLSRESYVPFPIIFFGAGTAARVETQPVTVDCIAPTIAKAIRIRAPNACSKAPL